MANFLNDFENKETMLWNYLIGLITLENRTGVEMKKKAIIDQITLIRQENNNIRQDYNNLIIERSFKSERLAILEERTKTKTKTK